MFKKRIAAIKASLQTSVCSSIRTIAPDCVRRQTKPVLFERTEMRRFQLQVSAVLEECTSGGFGAIPRMLVIKWMHVHMQSATHLSQQRCSTERRFKERNRETNTTRAIPWVFVLIWVVWETTIVLLFSQAKRYASSQILLQKHKQSYTEGGACTRFMCFKNLSSTLGFRSIFSFIYYVCFVLVRRCLRNLMKHFSDPVSWNFLWNMFGPSLMYTP